MEAEASTGTVDNVKSGRPSSTNSDDEEEFEIAANHLAMSGLLSRLNSQQQLYFYARFKQTKEGSCNTPRPSVFSFQAKQKWDAWKSLADMSPVQSMREYIDGIDEHDPEWRSATGSKDGSNRTTTASFGLSVSSLRKHERKDDATVDDDRKTIFDWVKEGNVVEVLDRLTPSDVNVVDEQGMGLLHWASDRGDVDMVVALVRHGAGSVDINLRDADGQTALHYASSCGHSDVLSKLVEMGADRSAMDGDGATAEQVACDDHTASLLQ